MRGEEGSTFELAVVLYVRFSKRIFPVASTNVIFSQDCRSTEGGYLFQISEETSVLIHVESCDFVLKYIFSQTQHVQLKTLIRQHHIC